LNTFFDSLKRTGRVFRAQQMAAALRLAAKGARKDKWSFLKRTHVFYREVDHESLRTPTLGAQLISDEVTNGHVGVMGLLYFDFAFKLPSGKIIYPQGYAQVREYGNPDKPGNKTRVYCWRKDLLSKMCQSCSDRQVWRAVVCVCVCFG
jgi:hypothetical protein